MAMSFNKVSVCLFFCLFYQCVFIAFAFHVFQSVRYVYYCIVLYGFWICVCRILIKITYLLIK